MLLKSVFVLALVTSALGWPLDKRQKGGNDDNDDNDRGDNDSLTLTAEVGENTKQDGQQDGVEEGQVASLTSNNNFINFCEGKEITNGEQKEGGSCNGIVMGDIPAKNQMPACRWQEPTNFGSVEADQTFTAELKVAKFKTGLFTNPVNTYYGAPQQLDDGVIAGHSHIVIQELSSFESKEVIEPTTFTFFKGLNGAAVGGVLSVEVTGGLPAGFYRQCSINTSANHAPCLVAVAQHGSLDDCIYYESKPGGGNNDDDNNQEDEEEEGNKEDGNNQEDEAGNNEPADGNQREGNQDGEEEPADQEEEPADEEDNTGGNDRNRGKNRKNRSRK